MNTQKLKIEQIIPNDYNPNHMTAEQFKACVVEIKSHGDALKPVVVRMVGDRYQIVDGEHSWRAAQTAGLSEITCQIVACDDFEAMRQTLVRNEHGTHNPVREAMVYRQMMEQHDLSNRELAKLVGKAEATIRNRLKYLEACERFEPVDGEDPIERIGSLTQDQIDLYLRLPFDLARSWLSAGADVRIREWVRPTDKQPLSCRLDQIQNSGLAGLISPKGLEFRYGVQRALALADWADQHLGSSLARPYLQPVMQSRLAIEVLDTLPRQIVTGKVTVLLPPDVWAAILSDCASRAGDNAEAISSARFLVRRALRAAGIDALSIASPEELAKHDAVLQAPELIRTADFLSPDEQFALAVFAHANPEVTAQEAVRLTVDHFRDRRTGMPDQEGTNVPAVKIHEVLQQMVIQLRKATSQTSADARPPEALVAQVTSLLLRDEQGKPVVEEPVHQLLRGRLEKIPRPELVLLAGLVNPAVAYDEVINHWRAAAESGP